MKQIQQEKKADRASERKRMVDWIESYHRINGEKEKSENDNEKDDNQGYNNSRKGTR